MCACRGFGARRCDIEYFQNNEGEGGFGILPVYFELQTDIWLTHKPAN